MKTHESGNSDMMLRSISPVLLTEIIDYVRELPRWQESIGIPPTNNLERFCIGFYQLSGAMDWKSTWCEQESLASAVIHFLVVMEALKMSPEKWLMLDLRAFPRLHLDHAKVLLRSSRATQMIFYARQAGKTERSKRYNHDQLEKDLGLICFDCICAIPTDLRTDAFHNATEILASRI